jgi:aryl-alcohol dehydrogenase-like predicted oxidoreductase
MRYKILGNSGVRISEVALGTMTFGDNFGWGAPKETSGRILDIYADAGGNVIDTADNYTDGTSEEFLGEMLQSRRDRFVVATKYTSQTDPGDLNSAGNHRKNLVTSLEASLRRLRTDYIDLYWVHERDVLTPVDEIMRILDDQVRAGKVLYVGVSDWNAWEVSQANTLASLRGWSPFVGVQLRYNLLDRTPERDLLPMAQAFDLPVFIWSPLAGGRLTGKYLRGERGRRDVIPTFFTEPGSDDIVRQVVQIADEGGWSPAQVALAWVLGRPGAMIPIIGARSEEQLRDNLASIDVTLGDEQVDRLERLSRPSLGFPGDAMHGETVMRLVYGAQWPLIDDDRAVAMGQSVNSG